MARFYPLYVRRSDGKIEVLNNRRKPERNEPTSEQLDQKPDKNGVSDYYREVPMEETKHLDWRRKLGGMLARELGFTDQGKDKGYMLVAFPENYRLYEHVKKSDGEGKTVKATKTHAGGGNERQDAYLYGHPMGRKKRFRSPADFYPHLYWLVTDETGDPDNCACKICTPEELDEKEAPALKNEIKNEVKALPGAKRDDTKPDMIRRNPVVEIVRQNSEHGPIRSVSTSSPTPRGSAIPQASPMPQERKLDQSLDLRYNNFMFRQGELVWFWDPKERWKLGIILRRWRGNDPQQTRYYQLQGLSHPFSHPTAVTIASDSKLRPWYSWSVPSFTCLRLNDLPVTYDTADWNGMFARKYGADGDYEVDGSILAAKSIDATYTPFDLIRRVEPQAGVSEMYWNGVYLGAEKVWVGDAIRPRTTSNTDVVIVQSVLERTRISAFNNQVLEKSFSLIGAVYAINEIAYTNGQQPIPNIAEQQQLPPRMVEDLRQRNVQTISTRRQAAFYKLVQPSAVFSIQDIKGRWYESTLLLPMLDSQGYQEALQRGGIVDVSLRINSRGDCYRNGKVPMEIADVRVGDRIAACGKALPAGVAIIDGVDAPPLSQSGEPQPDEPAQRQPSQTMANHLPGSSQDAGPQENHGPGFEDFMNLDGMDGDHITSLGQDYTSGEGGGTRYF